jgi:hypothetical protein
VHVVEDLAELASIEERRKARDRRRAAKKKEKVQ